MAETVLPMPIGGSYLLVEMPRREALWRAGVAPLPLGLLKKHKESERRKAPRAHPIGWAAYHLGISASAFQIWTQNILIGFIFLGAVIFVVGLALLMTGVLQAGIAVTLCGGAVAFWSARLLYRAEAGERSPYRWRGPAYWRIRKLEPGITVPRFAERLMRRIEEAYPGVHFEIEELVQDAFILDPVLYAVGLNGDRVPFAVWQQNGSQVLLNG